MLTTHRTQNSNAHPFRGLVHEMFGRDIGQFFGQDNQSTMAPRVNITETPEKYVVSLNVPGFAKEELKISAEKDILTVKGAKSIPSSAESARYLRREFQTSTFSRSFQLPESVRIEEITADYSHGLLDLSIPKSTPAKPAVHEINIG